MSLESFPTVHWVYSWWEVISAAKYLPLNRREKGWNTTKYWNRVMEQGTECISPAFLPCFLHYGYTLLFWEEQSCPEIAHLEEARIPLISAARGCCPEGNHPIVGLSLSLIWYCLWQAAAFKVGCSNLVIPSPSSPASREMCKLQRRNMPPQSCNQTHHVSGDHQRSDHRFANA